MDGNCTTYEYGLWETIKKHRERKYRYRENVHGSKCQLCMITNKVNDPKI